MSTSVLLRVRPAEPIDPERWTGEVPEAIAAVLTAAGQPASTNLVHGDDGPVRLRFQIGGGDRVEVGRELCTRLTALGYEANVCFSP